MTGRRIPAPGDPNAAQLAVADQKHALARATVGTLVDDARRYIVGRGYDPDDVGVWIDVSMHECIDAAAAMSNDQEGLQLLACRSSLVLTSQL